MNYYSARDKYIKNALIFENKNYKVSIGLSRILDSMFIEIDEYLKRVYSLPSLINSETIKKDISNIMVDSFDKMDDFMVSEMSSVYRTESIASGVIIKNQLKNMIDENLIKAGFSSSISNTKDIIKQNKFFTVEFEKYKKVIYADIIKNVTYSLAKSKTYLDASKLILKNKGLESLKTSQIKTLSRTMMKNVQNDAVVNTMKEASIDFVKAIGIIDSRQTDACNSLSNKVFKINDAPPFPIHYNCRSTYMAVPPWEVKNAISDLISFKDWYSKNKDDPDLKRLKYIY